MIKKMQFTIHMMLIWFTRYVICFAFWKDKEWCF